MLVLAYHILRLLSTGETEHRDNVFTGIKSLVTDSYEALLPLCQSLTRHTNTERLRVLHEYFTNGGFIHFFFSSPEVSGERGVILDTLVAEMTPLATQAEDTNRYESISRTTLVLL